MAFRPLVLASLASVLVSCADNPSTAIVVAISSEARVPSEVDTLEMRVLRQGDERFAQRYVLPVGAELPGTLTIYPEREQDAGKPILIQVGVSHASPASFVALREARTAFVEGKTKLLRINLRYACTDQAQPCPEGKTCLGGACYDSTIDPGTLPDAPGDPGTFFGDRSSGRCFDEGQCLDSLVPVTMAPASPCSFPAPSGAYNLAMVWAFSPGHPVVLEPSPREGYTVADGQVTLAPGLCEALADGRALGVWVSTTCPTKSPETPVCSDSPRLDPTLVGGAGGAAGSGGEAGQAGMAGALAGGQGGAGVGGASAGDGGVGGTFAASAGAAGAPGGDGGSAGAGGSAGDTASGSAGAGGQAGGGGAAGTSAGAGVAGTTGGAGAAGATDAGSGGVAGSGGAPGGGGGESGSAGAPGGDGGQGGSAGQAGASGAGAGGNAGQGTGVCGTACSCKGGLLCGPSMDTDCCDTRDLPGGQFPMGRSSSGTDAFAPDAQLIPYSAEQPEHPATVHSFSMDTFEVTVGRFRAYVDQYSGALPAEGTGAHPWVPGTGWQTAWSSSMPADAAAFRSRLSSQCSPTGSTWTDAPTSQDALPMNCTQWYEAFAFCIWDGGRLPTETEWEWAAAGGDENRLYPWGSDAFSCSLAHGHGCGTSLLPVGSLPAGAARWGHRDLAGNVYEWVLDGYESGFYATVASGCTDCVNTSFSLPNRPVRGGTLHSSWTAITRAAGRFPVAPSTRTIAAGLRCVHDP